MNMKRTILYAAALMLVSGSAGVAGSAALMNPFSSGGSVDKYTSQELSLDLFGSYLNPERKFENLFVTNARRGAWGGGVGANYFFLKYVGLGADVNFSDHPGRIMDEAGGNLILRLPLGNTGLAPYIFGGGGQLLGQVPYTGYGWFYDGGVGLEYRFTHQIGLFTDGRFMWSDRSTENDRLMIRAGLRLAF